MDAKNDDKAGLRRLLTRYQGPIRAEIQAQRRCQLDEAEKLTSEFMNACLRRDISKNIDPEKGSFRNFIKQCIVNFLRDKSRRSAMEAHDEANEAGRPLLDAPIPEADASAPVDIEWARQVLALAHERLEQECVAARRDSLLARLKPFLQANPGNLSYAAIAAELGLSEPAVRTACHRLRRRLGRLIQEEIRDSVSNEVELQEELRFLIELLTRLPPDGSDT